MITFWKFIQHEIKKGKTEYIKEDYKKFMLIRFHLTRSIIIALPLFIASFLYRGIQTQSIDYYLYSLGLLVVFTAMNIANKKKL